MLQQHVVVSSQLTRTARVMQVEGMFDTPPSERVELVWDVGLPIDERDWNVGLIVGASGSGKTTIARTFWPEAIATEHAWPHDKSVLDGFPTGMSIKDIVELLSNVGFSSPPSWLRPFHVLSNGEQFRVRMARVLAEQRELAVVDEFTSVVDRTVAQIGSAALARTIRKVNQRFVAVTCHEDVVDWLQPDWVYRPGVGEFTWRHLQRRPGIELEIARVHHSAWQLFKHHHYLDQSMHPGSTCFVAFWRGIPVAFVSWLRFPTNAYSNAWKGSRLVCLPDYQGVGIGNALSNYVASVMLAVGRTPLVTASHPAVIQGHINSGLWHMTRAPGMQLKGKKSGTGPLHHERGGRMYRNTGIGKHIAGLRMTAGFRYIGPPADKALAMAILDHSPVRRPAAAR